MSYRPGQARDRAAELARLDALGVHPGAALVLADAVATTPALRGDDARAYARHRRLASPLAREAYAAQARARRGRR